MSKAKEKQLSVLKDGSSIYETQIEYKKSLEVKATIRSYPKDLKMCWMKGSKPLKLDDSRYAGSCCTGDQSVLCIKHVTKEDEDEYRIKAQRDFEGEEISDTLKLIVIEGNLTEILRKNFILDFSEFLVYLGHSDDLLLWVSIPRRPSTVNSFYL